MSEELHTFIVTRDVPFQKDEPVDFMPPPTMEPVGNMAAFRVSPDHRVMIMRVMLRDRSPDSRTPHA